MLVLSRAKISLYNLSFPFRWNERNPRHQSTDISCNKAMYSTDIHVFTARTTNSKASFTCQYHFFIYEREIGNRKEQKSNTNTGSPGSRLYGRGRSFNPSLAEERPKFIDLCVTLRMTLWACGPGSELVLLSLVNRCKSWKTYFFPKKLKA